MNPENHERARKLLGRARVEGIPDGDRRWLDGHLAACSACAAEADRLAFAIDSLRMLSVTVRPEAVHRASLAVHERAGQLRRQRERTLPLWIAAATSSIWIVATTPYTWSAFAWLGRLFHTPDTIWQVGFLMWWFLPATALGAVAGWQHVAKRKAASSGLAEMNWR